MPEHLGSPRLLLVAGLAASCAAAGAAQDTLRDEVRQLARENQALEGLVELASSDAFYLLVDPASGELTLRLGEAILARVELRTLAVAVPRVAFLSFTPDLSWGASSGPEAGRSRTATGCAEW